MFEGIWAVFEQSSREYYVYCWPVRCVVNGSKHIFKRVIRGSKSSMSNRGSKKAHIKALH